MPTITVKTKQVKVVAALVALLFISSSSITITAATESVHAPGILGPGSGVGGQLNHYELSRPSSQQQKDQTYEEENYGDFPASGESSVPSLATSVDSSFLSSSSSFLTNKNSIGIIIGSVIGSMVVFSLLGFAVRRRREKLRELKLTEWEFSMTGHQHYNGHNRRDTSDSSVSVESGVSFDGDNENNAVGFAVTDGDRQESWGDEITESGRILFHPNFTKSLGSLLNSGGSGKFRGISSDDADDGDGRRRNKDLNTTGHSLKERRGGRGSMYKLESSFRKKKNNTSLTKLQKVQFAKADFDDHNDAVATDLSDLL